MEPSDKKKYGKDDWRGAGERLKEASQSYRDRNVKKPMDNKSENRHSANRK
jgi:hypothetical protein